MGVRSGRLRGYGLTGPTQKFTGKERDVETGLDFFAARYFSGPQGRFTSPDEWSGGITDSATRLEIETNRALPYADVTDPQTLNKYGYVRNNPLRYVDPTGHQAAEEVDPIREGREEESFEEDLHRFETAYHARQAEQAHRDLLKSGVSEDQISTAHENLLKTLNPEVFRIRGEIETKLQERQGSGLRKPRSGPGGVPPEERDPKRVWTKPENTRKLEEQEGRCAQCGKPIKPGEGRGHHIRRHADGFPTDDDNHGCRLRRLPQGIAQKRVTPGDL